MERDIELESRTGRALHERPRSRTGRTARPAFAGLPARQAVCGSQVEILFVRRHAAERTVRPVFIVPRAKVIEFAAELAAVQRNERQASQQLLERQDKPLDDGDGTVLADRTVPGLDPAPSAPVTKAVLIELTPAVADDVCS